MLSVLTTTYNTSTKIAIRMDVSNRTVSSDAINKEWQQIQKAQENPAFFRPLYERYYNQIFRFIYKRCLEEDVAADVCSQVFLKAMQKLGSYQFKGVPFSAWLYQSGDGISHPDGKQACRSAITSIIFGLQYRLVFDTPDRLFGVDLYKRRLAEMALAFLTQSGNG